jgi:DNA-binding transcriptional MerR regulator
MTSADDPSWTIAQIAQEFGVTHRTVRHYEQLGLLSPERRGTVRVYRRRDRIRMELIMRGRRLGFGLDEIRRIIDMYDEQPGEEGQLRYLLAQIARQRVELEERRRDIELTLTELDRVEERCLEDLARIARRPQDVPAP